MKNILLFVLALWSLGVQGQTLKTFSGNLGEGKITFTYYVDESGDEIRHGTFKYTQYDSHEGASYSAVYTGDFKDGFKNGTWSYTINQVDNPQGSAFNTGTTKMVQTYVDGMPNGAWSYNENIKIRAKRYSRNGWSWSAYEQIPAQAINVNFKNGILSGPLRIKTPYLDLSGQLNDRGLWIGKWITRESYGQYENDYVDGILKKDIARISGRMVNNTNYDAELLQLQDQAGKLTGEELENFCRQHRLTIKTIEGNKVYNINNTLNYDYFDHRIFLGKAIRGDKTCVFDEHDNSYDKKDYGRYMKIERAKIIPLSQISGYSGSRTSDDLRSILKTSEMNLSDTDRDRLLTEIKIKADEEAAYEANRKARGQLDTVLRTIDNFSDQFQFLSLLKAKKTEKELLNQSFNNINGSFSVPEAVDPNSSWSYVFDKSITAQRQKVGREFLFGQFSQSIKSTIPKPQNYRSMDENVDYVSLLQKAELHMDLLQKECTPRLEELMTLNDLYIEVSNSMDTIYDQRYRGDKHFTNVYLAYKAVSTALLDKIAATADLTQLFETAKRLRNVCQATTQLRQTDTKDLAKALKKSKSIDEKEALINKN